MAPASPPRSLMALAAGAPGGVPRIGAVDKRTARSPSPPASSSAARWWKVSSCAFDGDEQDFMVECVRGIERRRGGRRDSLPPGPRLRGGSESYEPGMFERCERDREGVIALYRDWGMSGDESVRRAIARRHLREVIRCIENASVGSGRRIVRRPPRPRAKDRRRRIHPRVRARAQVAQPRVRHHVRADRAPQRHRLLHGGAHPGDRRSRAASLRARRGLRARLGRYAISPRATAVLFIHR